MENILDTSRASIKSEVHTQLLAHKGMLIEKIISMGQTSDWICSGENEWVSVISGRGAVGYEDGTSTILNPGDHMLIPAGKRHKVEFTSRPCVWLCVYYNE